MNTAQNTAIRKVDDYGHVDDSQSFRYCDERSRRYYDKLYHGFLESKKPRLKPTLHPTKAEQFLHLEDQTNRDGNRFTGLGMDHINQLAILKLNGGLGTSMGCQGPKSLLKVANDKCFLDLIYEQLDHIESEYHEKIPLLLMNSQSTKTATEDYLTRKKRQSLQFLQSWYPRIQTKTITVADGSQDHHFYPPGHGEVFRLLFDEGVADHLLAQGRRYLFLSNSDNIGASFDPKLFGYFIESQKSFLMEVCRRTVADKKGGVLIQNPTSKKLRLVESAQVEADEKAYMQNTEEFQLFNTNSLWIDLLALRKIYNRGQLSLDLIVNPKTVFGEDYIQLEEAMGSAINSIEDSGLVVVSRARFAPVKTNEDLLRLRSNLYRFENGLVRLREKFKEIPIINLSDEYKKIADFEERFTEVPCLKDAQSLSIDGDIHFGKNVTVIGHCKLEAPAGQRVHISDNEVLIGSHKY